MMTFQEPTDWSMIVMDGQRAVAKARKKQLGLWLLSLENACWIDPRARQPIREDWPAGVDSMWSKYPQLLAVKTKREARKIMQELARGPF